MKKKYFILFYFLLLLIPKINPVYAQETEELHEFDELQVDKVIIAKSNGKASNQKFNMTSNSASLVKAFGPPTSKTIEFAEMDQVDFTVYRYPGAEISFYQDKVIYFRIKGPEFKVLAPTTGTNKFSIQVGKPISGLKPVFPKSYKNLNSDGVLFFWLYSQATNKSTKKLTKTRLEPGIGVFTTNGLITDIVFEE
ncbi:hypothetical protein [Adhaeribacter radiodurans]|uniref:Uncharacterized protein n=1 Tax=Adhaeribacter radiodurans TaxID=2745197 RepID=A0A7L7L866_9BACT|nr:hypothetical protein [Adhaeribacter radiodurans]QMU28735.1 hypothetical protein HUW48_12130 [Adhaeribacter radiodurans]